ncbi:hypothetical protein GCM10011512_01590 [Tersicoccus solisilvae]|uniref:Uncharacterized protein n=1 Tax=Tersicoccus solisilvae TaxID=1882339 RepID=A0ABQ1NJC6_9MICC|nr:hypothetical protein [Tersicoccus solisilvae]GGC78670.1 hypothetical protein GCM10011512_01590 [Tersicoccus solisilvae]
MTVADDRTATGALPGHTRITQQAIARVVAIVAAEEFDVPVAAVRTRLLDDAGRLHLQIALPVRAPSLLDLARDQGRGPGSADTLIQRSERARAVIARRSGQLTGAVVGRVDVDLTGIHRPAPGRLA